MAAKNKATEPLKHFVDWGNDSIKYLVAGSELKLIRSLYFTAPNYYSQEDFQPPSEASPIVEKDGKKTHWGEASRLYQQYNSTVREDKTSLIASGLFATLGEAQGLTEYTTQIVLSVPHLKRFKQAYPGFAESLVGTHVFYHNDQQMKVAIESLTVLPESYGSFKLAQKLGMAGQKMTLVIDIGCGTALYGLYQPSGSPVDVVCKERSGVVRLVDMLRTDPAFIQRVGDTPASDAVMDGLRDQSFLYGAHSLDFSDIAGALGASWWRGLISEAISVFHPYRTSIDAVVLTGGGANLARLFGYTKPILPDSQMANLLGMTL